MDLQFCYDSYAVVTYVCDYLTKTDEGLTKFMKEAIKEHSTFIKDTLIGQPIRSQQFCRAY